MTENWVSWEFQFSLGFSVTGSINTFMIRDTLVIIWIFFGFSATETRRYTSYLKSSRFKFKREGGSFQEIQYLFGYKVIMAMPRRNCL